MILDGEQTHLAEGCAETIYQSFHEYISRYGLVTRRAKVRFETRDWKGMRADATERLDLYKRVVDGTVSDVRRLLEDRLTDKAVWAHTRAAYSDLCNVLDDWELAETFFNSITRRIFATVGVDPEIEFTDTCSRVQPFQVRHPSHHAYTGIGSIADLIESILGDYRFRVVYADVRRDARLAAEKLEKRLASEEHPLIIARAEMLTSVFYRGKSAYLIGRFYVGPDRFPLVLALVHTPEGIVVDAVLSEENQVSILFSFTRSYFHVDITSPAVLVRFLKSIIPRKRIAELYISIGFHKHGKSELYCDLLQHLSRSSEKFEIAKGERGMVMEVFTMPDYDLVFKVIKDRFAHPKNTTRREVMDKYHLVFQHDRAGRLVDAQEFEHLKFGRHRFSEALLSSLRRSAGNNVIIDDDHVIIRHVYLERRVTPLNIYLGEADADSAKAAVIDFGKAIKDLAATNIFPGDLLLKNFGVTRHGRVVFYDYDELCFLSACNFRVMPASRSYEDEISAEPWFSVGENDVFPEEFRTFLGLQGKMREVFLAHHADLFGVDFWKQTQDRISEGSVIDIFPYDRAARLPR